MNSPRLPWLLVALAVLGAIIGYRVSIERNFFARDEPVDAQRSSQAAFEVVHDFSKPSGNPASIENVSFPTGAINGELVVHFTDRSAYLAYLNALADAGIAPLGQIDELLAVRIPESALLKISFGQYDGRASFSYRIEQPLPPVEIAPEALARLLSFGRSARAITGTAVGGQGGGVVVAVLDSGIAAHPQFDDVGIVRIDLTGDGIAGMGAAHGTSVASIIAGREGIAPNAELFIVRVLDDEGLGNSYHVAAGIVQAVDLGVEIINMSLGVYQDSPLLRQAVDYAHQRGVLMVAAPGNDGYTRMAYPAAYPEVLAVTAVDADGQQALFPNQSKEIDFAAPGVGILTAKEDQGTILFSGTSAAVPFVSGTLASLMSGENALPAKEAVDLLKRTLNDQGAPGVDPLYGAGSIDWDRLRERSTPNLLDVALADIYLQPDSLPGTTMPVEVIVQNRGTNWLSNAQLEVFIGEAESVNFTLGSLGPGQTTTRKVFTQIPALDSQEVLSLAARVLPENPEDDIRFSNNIKAVTFQPVR